MSERVSNERLKKLASIQSRAAAMYAIAHDEDVLSVIEELIERRAADRPDEDRPTRVMRVQPVASDWREFASRIERIGNDSDCPGDRDALLGIVRQMREIALHVEAEHARRGLGS